jgi:curli biogenesis system outer membrane secretion channel CsgG
MNERIDVYLISGFVVLGIALSACVTDANSQAKDDRGVLYKVADTIDSSLNSLLGTEKRSNQVRGELGGGTQSESAPGVNMTATKVAQTEPVYVKPSLPAPRGPKKVVAVSRFENRTSFEGGGEYKLGSGMADQLTDALVQSGHFLVLERQTLADVIGEQDLAASGRVSKGTSARTGNITAAQILVKGTITEFTPNDSGTDQAVSFMGVSVGSDKGLSHVGLIVRLINSTTGVVITSKRVETKVPTGGVNFGLNFNSFAFKSSSFKNTPLGKATQITIDRAVAFIAEELQDKPFEGRIIKTKGDKGVLLSAGARNGISVGDNFEVFSMGEELKDPSTGEILGFEEKKAGSVTVTSVKERYSEGVLQNKILGVKVGDVIRSE